MLSTEKKLNLLTGDMRPAEFPAEQMSQERMRRGVVSWLNGYPSRAQWHEQSQPVVKLICFYNQTNENENKIIIIYYIFLFVKATKEIGIYYYLYVFLS